MSINLKTSNKFFNTATIQANSGLLTIISNDTVSSSYEIISLCVINTSSHSLVIDTAINSFQNSINTLNGYLCKNLILQPNDTHYIISANTPVLLNNSQSITAYCDSNQLFFSVSYNKYTDDYIPSVSLAPTSLSLTANYTTILSMWSAPVENGVPSITGYRLEYSIDNTNWIVFNNYDPNTTSATITGLSSNTRYYVRAASLNGAGVYTYSNIANVTTKLELLKLASTPPSSTGFYTLNGIGGTSTEPLSGNVRGNGQDDTDRILYLEVLFNGVLNYNCTVSSEGNYDYGYLYLNSTLIFQIDGNQNRIGSLSVRSGDKIGIRYTKDGSVSTGSDSISFTLHIIPDLPPVVTSVTTEVLDSIIDLYITSDPLATSYNISYSANNTTYTTLGNGQTLPASPIRISGLTNNTNYTVKIIPSNRTGSGEEYIISNLIPLSGAIRPLSLGQTYLSTIYTDVVLDNEFDDITIGKTYLSTLYRDYIEDLSSFMSNAYIQTVAEPKTFVPVSNTYIQSVSEPKTFLPLTTAYINVIYVESVPQEPTNITISVLNT